MTSITSYLRMRVGDLKRVFYSLEQQGQKAPNVSLEDLKHFVWDAENLAKNYGRELSRGRVKIDFPNTLDISRRILKRLVIYREKNDSWKCEIEAVIGIFELKDAIAIDDLNNGHYNFL